MDKYTIRVQYDGNLLSEDEFEGTKLELSNEFTAVVEFLPKHYPTTGGITVDAYDESGTILHSYTFTE